MLRLLTFRRCRTLSNSIIMQPTTPRPLPSDALARLGSVAEVCNVLRGWGRADLAERLAYFASDEDLDDGDVPLTLESALGFLAFFGAVEPAEGNLDLGTTRDGWICAHWRFPDVRSVSLYFVDRERVDYAARKSDGNFIDLDRERDFVNHREIAERLVGMEQWFTWFKERPGAARWQIHST